MMKALRNIFMSLSLLAVAGCSNMSHEMMGSGATLTGSVTDTEGNPIEHIQVTLEWSEIGIKDIAYTSSEGIFKSQAYLPTKGDTSVKITLEDIDEEENGGVFRRKNRRKRILRFLPFGKRRERRKKC